MKVKADAEGWKGHKRGLEITGTEMPPPLLCHVGDVGYLELILTGMMACLTVASI